jgi:hypothetical protein
MISTLRANAQYIREMQRLNIPLTTDLWVGIAKNLQLAAAACDDAIAGIDKLIAHRA